MYVTATAEACQGFSGEFFRRTNAFGRPRGLHPGGTISAKSPNFLPLHTLSDFLEAQNTHINLIWTFFFLGLTAQDRKKKPKMTPLDSILPKKNISRGKISAES